MSREPARSTRAEQPVPIRRIVTISITSTLVILAGLYAFHRTEQFLIGDPRFALNGPDGAAETPTLEVAGAAHSSPQAIQAVFAQDMGRSIYLLPLWERRTTLRSVDWIRDASVSRLWPNHVVVNISERKPVAFVAVGHSRFGLIDEDGVVLPQASGKFTLPVLGGVHPSDAIAERRDRVHRLLRLTRDLGDQAQKISEVDVSDRDNLKVRQPWDGKLVTLQLGDRNFALRYRNFVNHYAEIRQQLPGAVNLDLRVEDRITVVE
jgi:cell division protein FtsQ